jgi:hypothetical protein
VPIVAAAPWNTSVSAAVCRQPCVGMQTQPQGAKGKISKKINAESNSLIHICMTCSCRPQLLRTTLALCCPRCRCLPEAPSHVQVQELADAYHSKGAHRSACKAEELKEAAAAWQCT